MRITPIKSINGLTLIDQIISEEQERQLIEVIDSKPWCDDLKRRTQHYGYKYNYTKKYIDESAKTDPIPNDLNISNRLATMFLKANPDQLIINEYQEGQRIAPHVDCIPCFGPAIASISLGTATTMKFSNVETNQVVEIELLPRTALLLEEDARYKWRHGIPCQSDGRRISLTYRTVLKKET